MKYRRILLFSCAVAFSCDDGSGSGGGGDGGDTETTSASTTAASTTSVSTSTDTGGQVDTTSAPTNPCEDDYHGNNTPQTALDLELDTTNTATVTLGDEFVGGPPETGSDQLFVCDTQSDFFWFDADCASYVGIEVRRIDRPDPNNPGEVIAGVGPADLYLYDSSSIATFEPIDFSEGVWLGFFLRPIHSKVDAGMHVIEVRPTEAGPMEYSLTVTVFPTNECS